MSVYLPRILARGKIRAHSPGSYYIRDVDLSLDRVILHRVETHPGDGPWGITYRERDKYSIERVGTLDEDIAFGGEKQNKRMDEEKPRGRSRTPNTTQVKC